MHCNKSTLKLIQNPFDQRPVAGEVFDMQPELGLKKVPWMNAIEAKIEEGNSD